MNRRGQEVSSRAPRRGAAWRAVLLALLVGGTGWGAEPGEDFLAAWLAAQGELKTWTAEFTQTRTLKALAEPLRTPGRVWYAAPDRFRWELGDPPQTIALRRTNELLVIYPRLKRAERYPLSAGGGEPWREALALMDAGFPASRAEFEARFRLVSLAESNGLATIRLEPRSPGARRFLKEIRLTLRAADRSPVAHELSFADGSAQRNDFTHAVANQPIEAARFEPELPADFTVVEPLQP